MSLSDQISSDIKSALKANDKTRLSILRMIKSAIRNKEIDNGHVVLNDDEVMAILNSFVKKGKESVEQFAQAGREELAAKEREELEIVQSYLPEQLSDDQIKEMAKEAIKETGASGAKDFGNVMKAMMVKTKGKADGKLVSALVKKLLEEA
ncbi:MAG: GatB/YqeY domain-containing protein [Thermodesulfovibrionia bacterium]|nr:GatB/YqeY domain-containing protein [Thermodesulfovibrionia bacterium]